MEEIQKSLGLKVQALRKTQNMTQEDLADITGVSWRTISNLERGLALPTLKLIYDLSQHFNISIDELLGNYKQLYGDTPPPSAQMQSSNAPNCYMTFNGQDVKLYKHGQNDGTRLQKGQLQNKLSGQSGGDDYQSRVHQNVPDKGPIPEGTYYADQDQRQNITALDAVVGTGIGIANKLGANIHRGAWNGGPVSWGTKRVWLRPDANTNTYGRSGFSIHGGLTKGSAGCIDIPWQTGKLSNYLDDCQDSVPVYIKYPKKW